jgi:hypothetical protein
MPDWIKNALDWVQRMVALIEVVKLLIAIGLGDVLKTVLTTHIPGIWLTPIWILSSAVILWLLTLVGSLPKNRTKAFRNPKWETVTRREFMNEQVDIDGKRFWDCSFLNITLAFHGTAPAEFMGACKFGGNLRLVTDSPPAMHYSKLCQIFSSLPGMHAQYVSTDANGRALSPTFEIKELPPASKTATSTSDLLANQAREIATIRLNRLADDAMMLVRLTPKKDANHKTACFLWNQFVSHWRSEVIKTLEDHWGNDAVAYFAEADGFNKHEPTGDVADDSADSYRELLYCQRNLKSLKHTLK